MLTEIGFVDVEIGPPVDTFGDARGEPTPAPSRSTATPPSPANLTRRRRLDGPAEPGRSMVSTQGQDARDRFADRYREERVDVVREIEHHLLDVTD